MKKILAAAALLAIALPAAAASGDAEVGQKLSAQCAPCHGKNGMSVSPAFPNIAGQYPDYIVKALSHYKNGKRKNPIMAQQVEKLTPRMMADLAAYFSSQSGLAVKH